jgi:sugar phosphate isomerase/epimerase
MSILPIALQLYTVRTDAAQDFVGTLKKVAAIGYKNVELAGLHNLSAPELKTVLNDLGLKVIGSHVPRIDLENSLPRVLEENHILGNKYIVFPWLPEDQRKTAQDWIQLAESLNGIAAKCKEAGFTLCYHNHDFEFAQFDGQTAYDIMFSRFTPGLVQVEFDVYWARHANVDTLAYIRRFAGQLPLVHLKDMTKSTPHTFAEVGEGVIDFKPIIEASLASKAEYFVVEQDSGSRPALESVEISWKNLQNLQKTIA